MLALLIAIFTKPYIFTEVIQRNEERLALGQILWFFFFFFKFKKSNSRRNVIVWKMQHLANLPKTFSQSELADGT